MYGDYVHQSRTLTSPKISQNSSKSKTKGAPPIPSHQTPKNLPPFFSLFFFFFFFFFYVRIDESTRFASLRSLTRHARDSVLANSISKLGLLQPWLWLTSRPVRGLGFSTLLFLASLAPSSSLADELPFSTCSCPQSIFFDNLLNSSRNEAPLCLLLSNLVGVPEMRLRLGLVLLLFLFVGVVIFHLN